jgi:hypothetical protein
MTSVPGAHIVTMHAPAIYTSTQLDLACAIAADLERGQFILTIPPVYDCDTKLGPDVCELCTWRRENEAA